MRPEQDENPEKQPYPKIEDLPAALGFVETEGLGHIRDQLTAENEQTRALSVQYRLGAEEIIDQLPNGKKHESAQIGFMIQLALIHRDAGRTQHYLEELAAAFTYTWNRGYDDLVAVVDVAIEAAIAQVKAGNSEN